MFQSVTKRFDPIPVKLSQDTEVVPDMAYTPREIIQKFSRGERVPLGFRGLYDSEDSDLDGFDSSYFEDDPTRDPDFDGFDFVEEKVALEKRQYDAKRRSKAKALEDSKRKASDEETSVSASMKRETTSEEASKPSSAKPNSE